MAEKIYMVTLAGELVGIYSTREKADVVAKQVMKGFKVENVTVVEEEVV